MMFLDGYIGAPPTITVCSEDIAEPDVCAIADAIRGLAGSTKPTSNSVAVGTNRIGVPLFCMAPLSGTLGLRSGAWIGCTGHGKTCPNALLRPPTTPQQGAALPRRATPPPSSWRKRRRMAVAPARRNPPISVAADKRPRTAVPAARAARFVSLGAIPATHRLIVPVDKIRVTQRTRLLVRLEPQGG